MSWPSSPSSARSSTSSGRSTPSSAKSTPSSARSSASTRSSVRSYRKFDLAELEKATNKFDDAMITVRGEFGITYKGVLEDGDTVAVKRYNVDGNMADEYRNEIEKLSKYRNPHLVSLIGKCQDFQSQELIVVHEYMENGTLADHLFGGGEVKAVPLSWEKRLGICIDAARGLDYLHHGTANSTRVIHRNVNPANILLNEFLTGKMSELGFARLGKANTQNSAVKTDVKGTQKYLDPHYNLTGMLTRRADVYAFGVVLFDVLFGKDDSKRELDLKREKLAQWTKHCLKDGSLDGVIDERLNGQISPECLKEFAELASNCLLNNPPMRPTMTHVVEKLESLLKTSQKRQHY